MAGKHGVLGAAAGCAVGRHEANQKDHEEAASKQMAAPAANAAPAAPVKQQ